MKTAKVQQSSHKQKSKVFLIDDHPIVRQGLALLINGEEDLEVCGESEGGLAVVEQIVRLEPAIVVLDVSLSGPDGLALLKAIRAVRPGLPVLMLSMHDELTYAERTIRAGANGYIMKQQATDKVLTAIRRILAGETYLSEGLASQILQHFGRGTGLSKESPLANLSDRELQVFRLIGEGRGTREIAQMLGISIKTVESYQAHLKEKLSLRSSRQLVQHAIEWSVAGKSYSQ